MKKFKAGTYKQQLEYKSFMPSKVNKENKNMKKLFLILPMAALIAACASLSLPKDKYTLIREKCPPNFEVVKLFDLLKSLDPKNSGYPDQTQQIGGGSLSTWHLYDKGLILKIEQTCKFQAYVDNQGKVTRYSVPAYGDPDYISDSSKNLCPDVLNRITKLLGTIDAEGNITCY